MAPKLPTAPATDPASSLPIFSALALTLSLVLVLAAAACGGAHPRGVALAGGWRAAADTVDGVVHVVNSPPAHEDTAAEWHLVPDLRIGTESGGGPAQFGQVLGIAVGDSGRVFVLDGQAQQVRIFSPAGRFIRAVGRKGGGPGEFRGAYGLAFSHGVLWVADHGNNRYTAFDRDGKLLATYRAPFTSYGYIWDGTVLRNGALCQTAFLPITVPPDRQTHELQCYQPVDPLAGGAASQLMVDTSFAIPRAKLKPETFVLRGGNMRMYVPVPFTSHGLWLYDPRGGFWTATTDRYRIARLTLSGDTALVLEARRPIVRVSSQERDSAIAALRKLAERVGASAPDYSRIPSSRPALQAMDLDASGRLWVRPTVAGRTTVFDVFDRSGRHVATVRAPFRVPTYWHPLIRDTALYALVTDSLDVPYVLRARIVR